MSKAFAAPVAYDASGFVAPYYAGWLTEAPRGVLPEARFVTSSRVAFAIGGIERDAASLPALVTAAELVSTPALPVIPLPPKRLAEQRGLVMASLAPLPPARPSGPPPALALFEEPARPVLPGLQEGASDEDTGAVEAPAGVEDAARPIDDAPETAPYRLTADRAPPHIEALIERHAERFNVPARLVRRVAWRESKFNPKLRHGPYWGLMQIRVDTARGLGFRGSASDLLDANTNMTYAVAYLANAYRVAGRDETRAVSLYARGYYYEAKRKKMLDSLIRVATSEP